MNRFDLENQAIQRRIADALERIIELLEETLEEQANKEIDETLRSIK